MTEIRRRCTLTKWAKSVHDTGRDILVQEVSHKTPHCLAVPNLAGHHQSRFCGGHASDAVTVDDVEVVTVWNSSIDALGIHQVKLAWTTFWIHYLHPIQHTTTSTGNTFKFSHNCCYTNNSFFGQEQPKLASRILTSFAGKPSYQSAKVT